MPNPEGDLRGTELASLSLQLGGAVALPTLFLTWFGHRLDVRYDTGNMLLITAIALSLFVSLGFVWVIVKRALGR